MPLLACRTIKCDVTGLEFTEEKPGSGFPGWGQLQGVMLMDDETGHVVSDPCLSPDVMVSFVDLLKHMLEDNK